MEADEDHMEEEMVQNDNVDDDVDDDVNDDDSDSDAEEMEAERSGEGSSSRAYLPGQPLEKGEELVCDESAYVMYHQAQTGAPCLSFDIIRDGLGEGRDSYPLTCYAVAGTQSSHSHTNNVVVMKMSNLHRVKQSNKNDDDEDESEEDSESDEENDSRRPQLETAMIPHNTAINRIRTTRVGDRHVACTWAESGAVHLWDLRDALKQVDAAGGGAGKKASGSLSNQKPLFTFRGHQTEGFSMDWSRLTPGKLVTGDCRKNIHTWSMTSGGTWEVDQRSYSAHTESVEDLQWSPTEPTVFASCSVDKSIRIWDVRAAPHKACMITLANAHDSDVNVISWNGVEARFIVSGGDDETIKVWDLAQYKKTDASSAGMTPVATFKHHTAAITSVEWHPTDSSVFAAAGADDQLSQWDIAMEKGEESEEEPGVLPQLLFIHQGQKEIKELHWHPQIPGVMISTALSGFNVFRTISV